MFPSFDVTVLSAFILVATDWIPTFNVEPFCRAVASRAVPVGDASICMRKEMEARDQLARQWTQFAPADKSHCTQLSTIGGDPTYTELLTCLELQRDARNLREKERGATELKFYGRANGSLPSHGSGRTVPSGRSSGRFSSSISWTRTASARWASRIS